MGLEIGGSDPEVEMAVNEQAPTSILESLSPFRNHHVSVQIEGDAECVRRYRQLLADRDQSTSTSIPKMEFVHNRGEIEFTMVANNRRCERCYHDVDLRHSLVTNNDRCTAYEDVSRCSHCSVVNRNPLAVGFVGQD